MFCYSNRAQTNPECNTEKSSGNFGKELEEKLRRIARVSEENPQSPRGAVGQEPHQGHDEGAHIDLVYF